MDSALCTVQKYHTHIVTHSVSKSIHATKATSLSVDNSVDDRSDPHSVCSVWSIGELVPQR